MSRIPHSCSFSCLPCLLWSVTIPVFLVFHDLDAVEECWAVFLQNSLTSGLSDAIFSLECSYRLLAGMPQNQHCVLWASSRDSWCGCVLFLVMLALSTWFKWCRGWMMDPKKICPSPNPKAQECDCIWKTRVCAIVIKWKILQGGDHPELSRGVLNPVALVLMRYMQVRGHRGEGDTKTKAQIRVMPPQARERPESP